jgi:hypothetical protein
VPVGRGKNSISTNIAIGTNALNSITSGTDNIAIGTNAQLNTAAISNCVAIGSSAMGSGSSQSVGIGSLSLQNSGNQSVAIGYAAVSNAIVSDTVGIGWASLYATQANHVVALGTNSGRYIANGSTVNAVATNSIFIGGITKALDTAQTNQIVIGYDATGLGSNTAVLGNASITTTALRGNVGIGTTAPSSKLHVAGNSSPAIAIENTIATGYSELLFKNTVATGSSIFLNGSTQTGYGGANSLNVYTSNGPLAFHTASVTNAISLAQSGDFKVDKKILGNNGINIGNTANNYDRAIIANSGGGLAITNGGSAGESLQFTEMTAPAAPAANQVRIYAEDDGTGKTRLMALFATGVAQQIAIQP